MEKDPEHLEEHPVKRKRGRPRTKERPAENATPKKRGRKPKPKEDDPKAKKTKKKFETKIWKASDISLTIMTRDLSPKRETILEIPINSDNVTNPDELLAETTGSQVVPIGQNPDERFAKRFKPDDTMPRAKPNNLTELVDERNSQDKEFAQLNDQAEKKLPKSLFTKRPKKPVSPPEYNPNIDIEDVKELKIVAGFNDDAELLENEIDEKTIEFRTQSDDNCSMSSSSMSTSESSNDDDEVFKVSVVKAYKKPGETFVDASKRVPDFQTTMPEHIPFSTSLINSGIVYKEIYSVLPEIYEFSANGKTLDWPERTSIHCLWDTYSFDTVPIPVPISYNKNLRKFRVRGCFCSFNCALAYSLNSNLRNTPLLSYFYTRWTGKSAHIKRAPPREALAIYGGTLTIDQFRKSFNTLTRINLIVPPVIPQVEKLEFSHVRPLVNNPKSDSLFPNSRNNLENVSKIIPETRLQRKVPMHKEKSSILAQFSIPE